MAQLTDKIIEFLPSNLVLLVIENRRLERAKKSAEIFRMCEDKKKAAHLN